MHDDISSPISTRRAVGPRAPLAMLPAFVALAAPLLCPAQTRAQSEDPAAQLGRACFELERAEIRARINCKTVAEFRKWRRDQGRKAAELALRYEARKLPPEAQLNLAKLFAMASDWNRVEQTLSRYLDGRPSEISLALCERIRARVQLGRMAAAREDLQRLLAEYPRKLDLALFLYALPALQGEDQNAMAKQVLERLQRHYRGDPTYESIVASLARYQALLRRTPPGPDPAWIAPSASPWRDPSARCTLTLLFRSSVPACRHALYKLVELQRRFQGKGLHLRALAPREGARFWKPFRPATARPDPDEEIAALERMATALGLTCPLGLVADSECLEKEFGVAVVPFFLLADSSGKLQRFYAGSENLDWLDGEIERSLAAQR